MRKTIPLTNIENLAGHLKLKDFYIVTLSYSGLSNVIFPFLL